jgi:16S rRNA (uracil1498-N3)-methyltransferase
MKTTEDTDSLSIMIGPEGGWSPEEMNKIRQNEIPYFSLGSQILKTETANVAISSLLLI